MCAEQTDEDKNKMPCSLEPHFSQQNPRVSYSKG